ncbi:hypothetical protein BDZ89DRAFT_1144906 [Hymenopellis radicata]|nr:hypothetical protein BDZ89DRAFT_1144906 [Hymenopellis radicata]
MPAGVGSYTLNDPMPIDPQVFPGPSQVNEASPTSLGKRPRDASDEQDDEAPDRLRAKLGTADSIPVLCLPNPQDDANPQLLVVQLTIEDHRKKNHQGNDLVPEGVVLLQVPEVAFVQGKATQKMMAGPVLWYALIQVFQLFEVSLPDSLPLTLALPRSPDDQVLDKLPDGPAKRYAAELPFGDVQPSLFKISEALYTPVNETINAFFAPVYVLAIVITDLKKPPMSKSQQETSERRKQAVTDALDWMCRYWHDKPSEAEAVRKLQQPRDVHQGLSLQDTIIMSGFIHRVLSCTQISNLERSEWEHDGEAIRLKDVKVPIKRLQEKVFARTAGGSSEWSIRMNQLGDLLKHVSLPDQNRFANYVSQLQGILKKETFGAIPMYAIIVAVPPIGFSVPGTMQSKLDSMSKPAKKKVNGVKSEAVKAMAET